MAHLFRGTYTNYVKCINVSDVSLRDEVFYDLQMPVKGCKDLYASFEEYVKEETLDGDNQYHSERFGKQDAKKGVAFKNLPPVLELHLRRFEYDFNTDAMAKVRSFASAARSAATAMCSTTRMLASTCHLSKACGCRGRRVSPRPCKSQAGRGCLFPSASAPSAAFSLLILLVIARAFSFSAHAASPTRPPLICWPADRRGSLLLPAAAFLELSCSPLGVACFLLDATERAFAAESALAGHAARSLSPTRRSLRTSVRPHQTMQSWFPPRAHHRAARKTTMPTRTSGHTAC
eukprot:2391001-Pleurochrysis_carterae.AAC.3